MKWTYSVKNKMAASGALFALCLLVLFSNYIDRDHTRNVKNAISTLYEDRLIAESYILEMTGSVYQIKELINTVANDTGKNIRIDKLLFNIKEINTAYLKTKFTDAEKRKAAELLPVLWELDPAVTNSTQIKLASANKALVILGELSAIQLAESKQIMAYAEKLYLSGKTSSQLVFVIIIVILLVLQALVFSSKTLIPTDTTKPAHLN